MSLPCKSVSPEHASSRDDYLCFPAKCSFSKENGSQSRQMLPLQSESPLESVLLSVW